jgi:uncharacterized membrane protein
MFLLLTVYNSKEAAKEDLDAVHELYRAEALKTYDAAIVVKDENGKIHVEKHEKPTQTGAIAGLLWGRFSASSSRRACWPLELLALPQVAR